MIRPGASQILINWGLKSDFEAVCDSSPSTLYRDLRSGEIFMQNIAVDVSEYPDWGTSRRNLQSVFFTQARKAGADIRFDASVDKVRDEEDRASILMKDGSVFWADLILAADGIRSRTRSQILDDVSSSTDAIISDSTFYGVKVPIEKMLANEATKKLCESKHLTVWLGQGRYVVGRLHEKGGEWGGLFGSLVTTDQQSLWDENGDIKHVRDLFAGDDPALAAALDIADSCDRWRLGEVPSLARWTSRNGRIILLGDSAHAMYPNAAQGFSQIIEDIGVLEYLLTNAYDDLPKVTYVWQEIRMPRVKRIQEFAAENTSMFVDPGRNKSRRRLNINNVKSLRDVTPDANARFESSPFLKWAQGTDVIAEVNNLPELYTSNNLT